MSRRSVVSLIVNEKVARLETFIRTRREMLRCRLFVATVKVGSVKWTLRDISSMDVHDRLVTRKTPQFVGCRKKYDGRVSSTKNLRFNYHLYFGPRYRQLYC